MVAAASTPALRARGLSKRYDGTPALEGVDLTVAPGELRGLLGPNGAGKTTLLRTLLHLSTPDAGEVELLGQRLAPGRGLPLKGVAGFVEAPAFYPYLTGRANLEALVELDDGDRARVGHVLGQVGLGERAADRVGGYSTGMRQRLGIAAALLRDPRLLLLDEPTSGLDPMGIRDVGVLLRELAADGVAIVISSHLIGELEALCDSYTIIRAGRVVWDGTAARLADEAPGSVHLLATDDDARARELAGGHAGVRVSAVSGERGLRLAVGRGALDAYVRDIVLAGLAVWRLELLVSPLASMFFSLTADGDASDPDAWLAERRDDGPVAR